MQSRTGIPNDADELQYIESNGTQWIDLKQLPDSESIVRMKFEITASDESTYAVFGARNSQFGATDAFGIFRIGPNRFDAYVGSKITQCPITPNIPYVIELSSSHIDINGVRTEFENQNINSVHSLVVFAMNQLNGVDSRRIKMRLFYMEGHVSSDFDLRPCRLSDGTTGLYDVVEGVFYSKASGDDFIAGPVITYPPEEISALSASVDERNVILHWNAGKNADSYIIYRNGNRISQTRDLEYLDNDVAYGTHVYSVVATNRYGESREVSVSIKLEPEIVIAPSNKSTALYFLDKQYDAYAIIDSFKSLLWTVRYAKVGEFELYVPADPDIVKRFHEGDYVWIEDSDRLMILEDINLQTDPEDGDYLILSGRSLESILERRIIWGMTVITGNFQNGIKTLLNRNVISPAIESRRIPNFTFKESTDPRITELTVEAQYFGENLYEEIEKLCQEKEVGFKVLPNGAGGFEFSLYIGEDRSYDQIKNPWVVFAPNYENLQSSNYLYSKKNFKNATLVGGQGENWSRDTVEVASDSSSGLDRRETFTDASGVTNDTSGIENDDTLTEEEKQEAIAALTEEYNAQLMQKGKEELAKTSITETFDGEIDASLQYIYRKDFDLGDIVQIVNDYGMEASSRVSEIVISHDPTGKTVVPTFTVKTDEKGDEE